MENWLRTDEAQEAVLALQIVEDLLLRVVDNPHYWSWVIIALHNSLQGFMVLALESTNGLNALTEGSAKKWMEAYERRDGKFPSKRLDSFLNLYDKIKSDDYTICRFTPSGTQDENVKRLNELRNDLIHFYPKRLSVVVMDLPQIVDDALDIMEFLAFESRNILWEDKLMEGKTRALIGKAKIDTQYIKNIYGG